MRRAIASAEQKGKHVAAASAAAAGGSGSKLAALFDSGADIAVTVEVLSEGDGANFDVAVPCVVRSKPESFAAFRDAAGVKTFLESFRSRFENDPTKVSGCPGEGGSGSQRRHGYVVGTFGDC